MNLSPALKKCYTDEQLSAREAQRLAEFIAWGPVVFQASRLMVKWGILDLLRDADEGLTRQEICTQTGLSDYAVKCLLEASLCGLVPSGGIAEERQARGPEALWFLADGL